MEELLESLELEKSSHHMGLSKVSGVGQPGRRAAEVGGDLPVGHCSTAGSREGALWSESTKATFLV